MAYLEISKYHQLQSWRDNTIGYIAYILTAVNSKSKVEIEKFLPPKSEQNKTYSGDKDMEAALQTWVANAKVADRRTKKQKE